MAHDGMRDTLSAPTSHSTPDYRGLKGARWMGAAVTSVVTGHFLLLGASAMLWLSWERHGALPSSLKDAAIATASCEGPDPANEGKLVFLSCPLKAGVQALASSSTRWRHTGAVVLGEAWVLCESATDVTPMCKRARPFTPTGSAGGSSFLQEDDGLVHTSLLAPYDGSSAALRVLQQAPDSEHPSSEHLSTERGVQRTASVRSERLQEARMSFVEVSATGASGVGVARATSQGRAEAVAATDLGDVSVVALQHGTDLRWEGGSGLLHVGHTSMDTLRQSSNCHVWLWLAGAGLLSLVGAAMIPLAWVPNNDANRQWAAATWWLWIGWSVSSVAIMAKHGPHQHLWQFVELSGVACCIFAVHVTLAQLRAFEQHKFMDGLDGLDDIATDSARSVATTVATSEEALAQPCGYGSVPNLSQGA